MRCFRKLLGSSYSDHITNEEVKTRTGNAIGPYEDLLTSMKRRKLKWYGHVTRPYGLAKTVLKGTVQGGRRRGRQRKRWEDNIKEWTGLEWNIKLLKAENREEWRKLQNLQWCPNGQPDDGIGEGEGEVPWRVLGCRGIPYLAMNTAIVSLICRWLPHSFVFSWVDVGHTLLLFRAAQTTKLSDPGQESLDR